jgi:hypothetical protein
MRRRHGLAAAAAWLACTHAIAHPAPNASASAIAETAWVDHDRAPIPMPHPWERKLLPHKFRESFVEPLSHAFDIPDKLLWLAGGGDGMEHDAANVNAFDEVSNSSWFTNRNHVRALPASAIRGGPAAGLVPKPPYSIRSVKREGVNPGFQVRDAEGRRWLFKLDPPGYPQLGSGAGVVSSRLLWAAGYNFSHDVSFRFRRDELSIDPRLAGGDEPFAEADLDTLLSRGHRSPGGEWYAQGSLFLSGTPLGPIDFRGRRDDDPNDWYNHRHRRELRGLYVVQSWLGNWDLKDHQSLATFERGSDSLGAVRHTLLDAGGSIGAAAEGPKQPHRGFEYDFDMAWIARRLFSLGFAVEPWRNADQETGIPSVGNFESAAYRPDEFKPIQPHAAFRERTDADGYWGAKIVASFSDAQIAAAIDAAGYEDARAAETIARLLRERRDKTARYWFGRVAPLDFLYVDGGALRFHDLAVDLGWTTQRRYEVRVVDAGGRAPQTRRVIAEPTFALAEFGDATAITLELRVAGLSAAPARVELERGAAGWRVRRVRHG